MRGEHAGSVISDSFSYGSSPHAWGIPLVPFLPCFLYRFIPTCVGNTLSPLDGVCWKAVHPHMRGEHIIPTRISCPYVGSSPHAWGTLLTSSGTYFLCTVHPHMRGEHKAGDPILTFRNGSSPHAWGTLKMVGFKWAGLRFIPTCVGNTSNLPTLLHRITVHPHMRGEHPFARPRAHPFGGSSPHAWGTHYIGSFSILQHRFVPTCVGNT